MLGAHGRPDWLDVSEFVVHFAKGDDGYGVAMSILGNMVLRRGPTAFGAARKIPALEESQRAVCFSEVPLGFLARLVERRGTPYGIGFSKRFIVAQGGAPIWYAEWGTPQHAAIQMLIADGVHKGPDQSHALWNLTPFIDFPSGPDAPYTYDFRWEREWRVAGDVGFTPQDVAFLFIPEDLHGDARAFFENAEVENLGPSYSCPFVDPSWNVERVREALAAARP